VDDIQAVAVFDTGDDLSEELDSLERFS